MFTTDRTLFALFVGLGLLSGCGTDADEPTSTSSTTASSPGVAVNATVTALSVTKPAKNIGDSCVTSDGWEPPAIATPNIDVSKGPVVHDAKHLASIGWKDLNQLGKNIGYCLSPGGAYPNGYFTMNCDADNDCPGSAFCYGGQCRRECTTNTDCGGTMTCSGMPKAFCQSMPKPLTAGR